VKPNKYFENIREVIKWLKMQQKQVGRIKRSESAFGGSALGCSVIG